MKKIYFDKIINIKNTPLDDKKFVFEIFKPPLNPLLSKEGKEIENFRGGVEIIFMSDLLEKEKNLEMIEKSKNKPAMWEQVYSKETELKIFEKLFSQAKKNNKKIHIIWITLKEEIEILEKYYSELWFFKEEINAFDVDFSRVLVSASVNIENLIYRWSNYKAMKSEIFFNPPIRESGQTKAMFKGINRGVTAWIFIKVFSKKIEDFLTQQIIQENILPIALAKVLNYNLEQVWISWEKKELIISY